MKLSPGTKLGPYEILAPIGAGGMGEVWKARDTRLGRIVAIKKVKEQHSERFKQEARSIAALNHPNICQLFDIGPDYLVLEYVEGKPLSSPLPEKEAMRLAIQIAAALEAAHNKGIIHRDLKPANIMVTAEGSVKLLDFGLAKLYEQRASESTAEFPATQTGAVVGTVAYMSPEQAQGQTADARSDIFSFGLVLYEMLSGRRAFSGDSNYALMDAIVKRDPSPLRASSGLNEVVRQCLMKQPSGRYQTMSEVKSALEQVFAEKPTITAAEAHPSIAVLPFINMSGDKEQEYFSDGLAEEIINALTQIPGLKVIARTSAFAFKGRQEDIRRIADILGVANILEGSVRKAGNRVRVTAQLITAADGSHLWSDRYERDMTDVFAIQDEIAAAIAAVLKVKLSAGTSFHRSYEPTLAAHEAYLKARYLWGTVRPEAMRQAREYLEQAISLDPKYGLAHCGLADHFLAFAGVSYMPAKDAMLMVRQEAQKALDIDPSLPEAHAMLGIVAGNYDYDWIEAKQQFRLAMVLDPVPARVRQWYGFFHLLPLGQTREALAHVEQGLKEDPLNLVARFCYFCCLFNMGKLAEAKAEMYKALELEAGHWVALYYLAFTCIAQEKWAEAHPLVEKAASFFTPAAGTLAGVLKRMGEPDRAEELVQKLLPGDAYGAPLGLASFYTLCRETDKAADWLEKSILQRHPFEMTGYFIRSFLKCSPRWPQLAQLMNLPEEAP
jgi:eukaryotic-like serine/threonine-protein kinase